MEIPYDTIRELVVVPGHINEADFELAEKEAKDERLDLAEILVLKGLIKDEQLGKLIADDLGYKFVDLANEKISDEVLRIIPELVSRSRGVIAISRSADGLKVGMTDPGDLETVHFLEKRTGDKVIPHFITKVAFINTLSLYKASLKDAVEKILKKLDDRRLRIDERNEAIVKMVDTLLVYGFRNNASDIHIEPYRNKVVVRFRIDGIMHDVLEVHKDLLDPMVTRVKILSKLRTDEHRAAQDGRFTFDSEGIGGNDEITSETKRTSLVGERVDVRVSVVPIGEGENVVMRLLSAKSRQFGLSDLGLGSSDLKKVESAIASPHGMILVTGPTGSGKTTTLYGLLKILNKRDVHISTIEDPVEYNIEGISQIQVNPKTNLTFASGLRSIVRQDPDIIMVGEIRDPETADIAVNSAMTGHLVFSTLHANDSATTLPRLLDMGVEPFLIASTVRIAIAQRLVRRICERCRLSSVITNDERNIIENDPHIKDVISRIKVGDIDKLTVFRGQGCRVCANTGYSDRVGIFEVLEMKDNIKELVLKRASSVEIMNKARENGMRTMLEDGIEKVFEGITTIEEILRVTRE